MAITVAGLGVGSRLSRIAVRVRVEHLVLVAVLAALAGESLFFVFNTYLNRDEGWYLLSGKLAYSGHVPYRDFPYFQSPLLPYLFGATQQLVGTTVISARLTSALFGAGSLALLFYLGERLGSRFTALAVLIVMLWTPSFTVTAVTARSEAVVVPLTLLAVTAALRWPRGLAGFAIAPSLLLLATAARVSFLPAFAVSLLYCFVRAKPNRREALLGLSGMLAIAALMTLPFIIASPDRSLFDIWTSQVTRNDQFGPAPTGVLYLLTNRIWFVNLPASIFFVAIIPALFLLAIVYERYREGWRPGPTGFGGDLLSNYLLIIGFALVLWLPFGGFDHQDERYFIPSFALLVIPAADLFVRSVRNEFGAMTKLLPPVFAMLLAAHALFQFVDVRQWVDKNDVRQTNEVGAYIHDLMSSDEQLVSFNSTLAVAADRNVAPQLVMGQFSYWADMSDENARRNGVLNTRLLENLMLDPKTAVIALDDYDLGLIARVQPEAENMPAGTPWPFKLFPELDRHFALARTVPNFGQFNATLYVLRRVASG